ncbi:hypothetical protein [Microvirga sesbaniae]|uniref:hypothetical protein n=1 Tax=Microvirga sesbaniae TaxID=681392 RepID=UPI0021C8ABBE|nr:hypothetical protein [Microvirga sp. HBU67692]
MAVAYAEHAIGDFAGAPARVFGEERLLLVCGLPALSGDGLGEFDDVDVPPGSFLPGSLALQFAGLDAIVATPVELVVRSDRNKVGLVQNSVDNDIADERVRIVRRCFGRNHR